MKTLFKGVAEVKWLSLAASRRLGRLLTFTDLYQRDVSANFREKLLFNGNLN